MILIEVSSPVTPLSERSHHGPAFNPPLLAALAVLAVLSGCGGSAATATSTPTIPATPTMPATPNTPTVGTDVTTYKNDVQRTGQNTTESVLTTANVTASTFGLLRTLAVDGKVDAQPLYLSKLTVAATNHNVVFIATENNSVYAFDADSGADLWKVSLTASGETTSDTHSCSQVTPQIGITSTPVIDRSAGVHGTLFAVAMSKDAAGNYHQRVHALDVTTGAEMTGSPKEITATYMATSFAPGQYEERAALLLVNGTLYTSWTSHCDDAPYGGWVIAFSESTLAQLGVLNVAPGASGSGFSSQGPAIWMSGGGPAADAAGNVYVLTGNGRFETTVDGNGFPSGGDYGNSFVKISSSGGVLAVSDYFALKNGVTESGNDQDLGSGGIMLLPDLTDANNTVRHLAVGAGKDSNLYVVSRDSLGKFSATANNIWQELDGALPGGIWSTPAYFNGSVYYGTSGGTLRAFSVTSAQLSSSAVSQSATPFTYPGTSPVASANGTSNGIIWAYENATPAVLHAYDAANLAHELYNSSQAANGRDQFGAGNKFIAPTVADGKVFVASTTGVGVFGLLQ
ncbi:MAG: PQQ-binding-like beta-propeller repeat protein [Steroidobacteraceae bacterium]